MGRELLKMVNWLRRGAGTSQESSHTGIERPLLTLQLENPKNNETQKIQKNILFSLFIYLFLWSSELNSGPYARKTNTLGMSYIPNPYFILFQ
jgi:hypothetical protein